MGKIKNLLGNYQSIPRQLIFDNDLSDRARFVYCFMASKPEDWDFYLSPMAKELGYSVDTLRKYIQELVDSGWLTKGVQSNEGSFGAVEYTINPTKKPYTEISDTQETHHKKKDIDNNKEIEHKEEIDKSISKKDATDYVAIADAWNKVANTCGIATLRGINTKRKTAIKSLLKNCDTTQEELIMVINSLPYADDWLFGKNDRGWKIDFDWLVANTSNWYVKALEGSLHRNNKRAFDDVMKGVPNADKVNKDELYYNEKGELVIGGVIYR